MGMNYEQELARRRQLKRKPKMIGDDYNLAVRCERLERENAALREVLKTIAFDNWSEHRWIRDIARAALAVSGAKP